MRHTTPSLSPQPVRCEHCTREGAVLGSTDEDDALDCKKMKELGLLSLDPAPSVIIHHPYPLSVKIVYFYFLSRV